MNDKNREMKEKKNPIRRNSVRYLMIAAFFVVFAAVYGHFSHEISSVWMSTLFVWPLALGGLPALLQELGILPVFEEKTAGPGSGAGDRDLQGTRGVPVPMEKTKQGSGDRRAEKNEAADADRSVTPGNIQADLWRFGIAALTAAGLLKGILEIAGTDSAYPDFLQAGGGLMLAVAAVLYLLLLRGSREKG